ncbi:MAG: bacterial proteasome activator family protein [Actinomycetota bacterium]|nr:bacterial proteasome activator family protein [Actinomycetota bacterium]
MTDDVEVVPQQPTDEQDGSAISEPGKLMRIAVMLRELQGEVRRAAPDQAGRDRLRTVHERALHELCEILPADLQDELGALSLPFEAGTPTESEILVAQAQLVGWLEGLFQGIQAAMFNQQLQARQQFEQMRQRGLPPGAQPETPQGNQPTGMGQYL